MTVAPFVLTLSYKPHIHIELTFYFQLTLKSFQGLMSVPLIPLSVPQLQTFQIYKLEGIAHLKWLYETAKAIKPFVKAHLYFINDLLIV